MVYESVILQAIFTFLKFLWKSYDNSFLARIVRKFASAIKSYASGSVIWNFVKRKDFFSKTWDNSVIFKVLECLIKLPSRLCSKAYRKVEGFVNESIFFRLLKVLLERLEIIIGISFALIVIIPYDWWRGMYGVIIVAAIVFLFFIKTVIDSNVSFSLKPLDFALAVFILSIVLAAVMSLFPEMSFEYMVLYLTCFLLVMVIANSIKTGQKLNSMLEIFLIGISMTAFYGLWQWKVVGVAVNPSITDVRLNPGLVRIYSTMGNENVYGELLVLALPFFWAVVFNSKTLFKKALYVFLFVVSVVGLLLTGSRSAWISFAVSMMVLLFFKNRKLLPVVVVLGILCIPVLPQPIYRRIMSIFNPNDKSVSTRGEIYEAASPMLKDYWTTGVGLGTEAFQVIFKRYQPFGAINYAHTHNLYLQLWLEAGVVAVISFVWMVIRIIKKSVLKVFGNIFDSYVKNILITGISSVAGILVMGLADHIWFFNRIVFIFWMVIGIILAGLRISSEKEEQAHQNNG
ncbi:MAG TPA: hypothetical protein GXX14_12220 [Clostridiaceae bacterium]|nr:hypothetical protein [Clostridiaceae bacterium]